MPGGSVKARIALPEFMVGDIAVDMFIVQKLKVGFAEVSGISNKLCLLEDILTRDRLIITSGRLSSEILQKIAKRNVPVVVSISAPTDLGIKIAAKLGITLIGLVRGGKMNVYSDDLRVI